MWCYWVLLKIVTNCLTKSRKKFSRILNLNFEKNNSSFVSCGSKSRIEFLTRKYKILHLNVAQAAKEVRRLTESRLIRSHWTICPQNVGKIAVFCHWWIELTLFFSLFAFCVLKKLKGSKPKAWSYISLQPTIWFKCSSMLHKKHYIYD